MKKITVIYYPYKWLNWKRVATGSHPEGWHEITPAQLIAIVTTYKGEISDVNFLHVMTGIKKRILRKLTSYHHYKLIELMDFINDLKPFNSFIIKTLNIQERSFFAPKPNLKNMTFGQFIFIDSFFENYQTSGDKSDMDSFLAALYLPPDEKFRETILEKNSSVMAKVDTLTREAIWINYLLIKEWLTQSYPLLFYKQEEEKDQQKDIPKKKKQHDSMAWVKILESIVGDDIINHDRYAQVPLHNMLRFMTSKLKENMKRK